MIVTAKPNASKRTKERLKRFEGKFTSVSQTSFPTCFQGKPAKLFRTANWIGWLPTEEITIS